MIKNEIQALVTFHDPCYLGRANNIYDAPRELLQLIPGIDLLEMSHSREMSLCCGGGGGGMWLDGFRWEKANARISEWRMREAVTALGRTNEDQVEHENGTARILTVACPYEPSRFADATKTVAGAEGIEVLEITELLAEAIGIQE
jgi:Fe-S oxidoreductase